MGGSMFPLAQLPQPPRAGRIQRPTGEPGGVVALDWAGFRAAVSYTFDDANSTQIQNYAALQALGVRMTFYLQTNKSEASSSTWARALDDGHELGNHTRSHAMTDDGSDTDAATQFIETMFGVRPLTMAAPYGATGYKAVASTRFMINRGVDNGLIKPRDGTDPFSLFCYVPPANATTDILNAQVDSAQNEGGWRVVLVHGFTGGSDGAFQPIALEEFVAAVEYAKSLGNLWVDSVLNIGAYWLAQKAFASAAPEVEPDGTIKHTWTLPEHFPSGRILRVTANGGTLTQGDRELLWNELGYYEVSLDERSLRVAT